MHKECAGAGVYIGPGVADFTSFFKNVRNDSVAGLNEVHEVIVLNVSLSEIELAHEARVCLTENGVTVAGNNLARGENLINIIADIIFSPLCAKVFLEVKEELEALLVCESMKRTSKSVHTSGEGQVGVRES